MCTATTEIYTLSLHDALPIFANQYCYGQVESPYGSGEFLRSLRAAFGDEHEKIILTEIENKEAIYDALDRKSTRLNSSHSQISYAVFCLKKKKYYKNNICNIL